jgi:predicted glycogen debranching enzyme
MTRALKQTKPQEIVCVPLEGLDLEGALSKEWLLTNERGSYSASTIVGCNTSGYHGLLVGSPDPLVNRVMALSNCLETVLWGRQALELSTFEFPGRFAPTGYVYLREFRRDLGAHFAFRLQPVDLYKAVYLARDSDTVVVEYSFDEVREPVDFFLRPFLGLRDFHALQRSHAAPTCDFAEGVLFARDGAPLDYELSLSCPGMRFEPDAQWWFNFVYRVNRDRGHYWTEDLWTPGFFGIHIGWPTQVILWARLGGRDESRTPPPDVEAIKRDLLFHQRHLIDWAGAGEKTFAALCLAADQFVVKRQARRSSPVACCSWNERRATCDAEGTTIVAGFPWFADWGRDTFISLPGLLLATGRREEARAVLSTFAAAVDEGMIPNHFDDRTGRAHFNSVDASLWFINAAFDYLDVTGDIGTFSGELLAAIAAILDAYQTGTRFGIHADSDGLITAGDSSTQLTWMDAKCDGIAFTPRHGKAVEVNALWHSALRRMERFCRATGRRELYGAMAARVGESFARLFWNEQGGYLNDTTRPDGSADTSLRPNQILAVALPDGPPLTRAQQRAVVNVVERELLTPYGLRTLNRANESYHGRYEGSPRCRDEAYHQGTVWPWLIGPFVQAFLRVHDFSPESKQRAAELLRPLLRHLVEDGCLGSVSEIFDGDPPQRPAGCHAQAWSVAELIRAWRMVTDAR